MTQEIKLKEVEVDSTEERRVTFDELYKLLTNRGDFGYTKMGFARKLNKELMKAPCLFMRFNLMEGGKGVLAVVPTSSVAEALVKYGGEDG